MITTGVVPEVEHPVALIGIAEKGYLSLELIVQGQGGHSAAPPGFTTAERLSRAVTALEENPFPVNMEYARWTLENVGPFIPFSRKLVMANLWVFQPLIQYIYRDIPEFNATIRTTTAPTMLSGGIRENVLPRQSKAVINFQIMPGESMDSVTERVRKVINDPEVEVRKRGAGSNPALVSDSKSDSYNTLATTIRQTHAEMNIIITPYLTIGTTTARHYAGIADNVYLYLNYQLQPGDLERIHGINERISVAEYTNMIEFYYQLIRNSDEMGVQ
jgi:carboxypeptidase PM20D1